MDPTSDIFVKCSILNPNGVGTRWAFFIKSCFLFFVVVSLQFTNRDGEVDAGHKGGDRDGKNQQRALV